jgi:hypothetical protein
MEIRSWWGLQRRRTSSALPSCTADETTNRCGLAKKKAPNLRRGLGLEVTKFTTHMALKSQNFPLGLDPEGNR